MLNKFPNTAKYFIWILTYLQIGMGSHANINICLEENRQINMEIACDCSIGNPENQTAHEPLAGMLSPDPAVPEDFCGPCLDFSFSLKSDIPLIRTQRNVFEVISPIFFSKPVYLPTSIYVYATDIVSYPSLVNNYTLSSLRTVVLLI